MCVSFWPFFLEMVYNSFPFSERHVFMSQALLVFTAGTEAKPYKMTSAVLKQALSRWVFVGVAQSEPTGMISQTGRLIISLKDGLIVIQQALLLQFRSDRSRHVWINLQGKKIPVICASFP